MAGAFLQTSSAPRLPQLTVSMNNIRDSDRDTLSAFLSGGEGDDAGYAPAHGDIVGILKQMLDTMLGLIKGVSGTEEADTLNFSLMLKGKLKLNDTLTKAIEDKPTRPGELMVELVNVREDLDDTSRALVEDRRFPAVMDLSGLVAPVGQHEEQQEPGTMQEVRPGQPQRSGCDATAIRAGCRHSGRPGLCARDGADAERLRVLLYAVVQTARPRRPQRSSCEATANLLGVVMLDVPALAAATEQLRSDREFVQEPAKQDGQALFSAAARLRSDREFVVDAVMQDG